MSAEYEARGLTEVCVDNEQIAGLHTENNRERTMNQSLQRDVEMLRAQLARGEQIRVKLESEILEQKGKIVDMHTNHQQQINEKEANYQKHLNEKEASWQLAAG